jgi:hypothetical protein
LGMQIMATKRLGFDHSLDRVGDEVRGWAARISCPHGPWRSVVDPMVLKDERYPPASTRNARCLRK